MIFDVTLGKTHDWDIDFSYGTRRNVLKNQLKLNYLQELTELTSPPVDALENQIISSSYS